MSAFSQGSALARRAVVSPNFGARRNDRAVDMLVLHYTGCPSAESALLWMCSQEAQVSAHYLVDEDGEIVQLVDEAARAWHAGASCWAGERDINSCSIGIEIQNPGPLEGELAPYPDAQIEAVVALARDIAHRHGIAPHRIVGHSDIAPARKADPGEHFPWARLAEAGLGLWVEPVALDVDAQGGVDVAAAQGLLRKLGYGMDVSGQQDEATREVIRAFQRHWRPSRVDGELDVSTMMTLERLAGALDRIA